MKNADVVVIGAGSVGANVAYRLAQRGARVTVLEGAGHLLMSECPEEVFTALRG